MRLFYVENACNVFKDQQLVMVFFRMEFHFLILEYVSSTSLISVALFPTVRTDEVHMSTLGGIETKNVELCFFFHDNNNWRLNLVSN